MCSLRMNAAADQTIILGLKIFLDHRSLRSIDQKILPVRLKNFLTGSEAENHITAFNSALKALGTDRSPFLLYSF